MANPFRWLPITFTDPGNQAVTNITTSGVSNVLNESIFGSSGLQSLVLFGTVDVNTPSAVVMASATDITDGDPGLIFESEDHGFATGLVVQFTTSNALPTGIELATDYYVIVIDADFFMVATSAANAYAGTAVDYTDTGTGNQTATPVALADGTIELQGSFDNEQNWATIPNSATAITADASFVFELDFARYAAYRVSTSLTTGMMAFSPLQIGYRGNA